MKHLQTRKTFLNGEKVEKIDEVLQNDIAWGDSLLGRMINSLIRKGKVEINAKRVDSLLNELRGELDKILSKTAFKDPESISIVVRGIINGLYLAVKNNEPVDKITNLTNNIITDLEKGKYEIADDYKKELIDKLNKFKESLKEETTTEEGEGEKGEDVTSTEGSVSYPDIYNKSLTKYTNKINISLSSTDVIDKILKGEWNFVNGIQGQNFKVFASSLVKMLTNPKFTEFCQKTNQSKLLQALSKVKGQGSKKEEQPVESGVKSVAEPKKADLVAKVESIDFDDLFYCINEMEHLSICINEEATTDDVFKSLIINHKKDITNALNLFVKRDIEASKKDPKFVKKNKEKFGANWETKILNSAKGALKRDIYGLDKIAKGGENKEILKKNQLWGIGKATTIPLNVSKGDTIIKIAYALDKVQRENPKAGPNEYQNLIRKTIDALGNNPVSVDNSIKQKADMIYGVNKSIFEKSEEQTSESIARYFDFIKMNEAEDTTDTTKNLEQDVTGAIKETEESKLLGKFKSTFAPKDYSLDTEEIKKGEVAAKKGIEDNQNVSHDSILNIIDLFGRAYRLTTTNMIPSGRKGGKVSNKTFNEYEHLSGGGGTPDNPGTGPWRNIKVFDKWSSGVRKILGDMRYRKLFSDGSSVNGVKNGGKYLINFMNKMINDKTFCTNGAAQSDFINQYFNIKKEEDPGKGFYNKPGLYTDGERTKPEKIEKEKEAKEIKLKKSNGISAKGLRENKHMMFVIKCKNADDKEVYWSLYTIGAYDSEKEKKFFARGNRDSLDIINRYIGKGYKLGKSEDIKMSKSDPEYYAIRLKNYAEDIIPGKKIELSYVKLNEPDDKDLASKVNTATYDILSVHLLYDENDKVFVVKDTDQLKDLRSKKDGLFSPDKYVNVL